MSTAAHHAEVVTDWVRVCRLDDVPRGGGVAALVDGHQVAVFRTDDDHLHALDNHDPFTGANVLSRGIVGANGAVATVASPLRKHRFDLTTGTCLDDPGVVVAVHEVRLVDDVVEIRPRPLP